MTSEVAGMGVGASQNAEFAGGDVVWAKFARFPWWPALVQDEKDLNDEFKRDKPAEHNVACLGGSISWSLKIRCETSREVSNSKESSNQRSGGGSSVPIYRKITTKLGQHCLRVGAEFTNG